MARLRFMNMLWPHLILTDSPLLDQSVYADRPQPRVSNKLWNRLKCGEKSLCHIWWSALQQEQCILWGVQYPATSISRYTSQPSIQSINIINVASLSLKTELVLITSSFIQRPFLTSSYNLAFPLGGLLQDGTNNINAQSRMHRLEFWSQK